MQENQHFRTQDAITVYSLLIFIFMSFFYVAHNNLPDRKIQEAYIQASGIAGQLGSTKIVFSGEKPQSGERRIASEAVKVDDFGMIGLDPWGRPYTYKTKLNEEFGRTVYILSFGPNQKRETADEHIEKTKPMAGSALLQAQGDDILVSRTLKYR